jgi:hypothetical protein
MKRLLILITLALFVVGISVAQTPPTKAPVTLNPIVDLQGKIVSIKMMPGQGMPAMEVEGARPKPITVWLGSIRYLLEQNFSPKVGDLVEVKGYSVKNQNQEEEIVAIQVKLGGQTLKLRDENGWPAWGGGGRGMMGGGGWCGGGNCDGTCQHGQMGPRSGRP